MARCGAPGSSLDAAEEDLRMMHHHGSRHTLPFHDTGHPALALPVDKSSAGLPVSRRLAGRCIDGPLRLWVAYAYQHATDGDTIITAQG
jgi:Asp-tRNA(Asn)/Glu-tRNA(Gln) amidotransferase A subunit family amidase